MPVVREMKPADAADFISYLREKRDDNMLFLRWAAMYQGVVSFDEFKHSLIRTKYTRSDAEIEEEVLKAYEKAVSK